MSVYDISLRLLSPVHIGDGDELRQDFDFAVRNGLTYRLNEDAILRFKKDRLAHISNGIYPPPAKLLDDADFENGSYFRYVLRGVPRSAQTDARVKSFIKNVHDLPYIPGSSLKGALRTALAWTGWKEIQPHLDRSAIGRNPSWAGQPLERKLFGSDPNHDLLRTLHVSDLMGQQEEPGQGLALVNAKVLTMKSQDSPVELEAVIGDLTFNGTLTIDKTLFTSWAESELHFQGRQHWLSELCARAQAHSLARIQRLVEWFEKADHTEQVAQFYRQLLGAEIAPNQALLQIGWGCGWDGKTFWTHLQTNADLFEDLVQDFHLHKAGPNSPPRKAGDAFPRSKRAVMAYRDGIGRAVAPFGWVLLEMNERKTTLP